jgi:hypothetical protein
MVFVGRLGCLALTVISLSACGGVQDQVSASPASTPLAQFQSRPLALPSLAPNGSCPVTPRVDLPTTGKVIHGMPMPNYGFGEGPVYLSGQLEWYAGQVSIFLIRPAYTGAALTRGHRLDGSGGFPFNSPSGQLAIPPAAQSSEWRMITSSLPSTIAPGCYGVQIDGDDFSEVVVFKVLTGPAPSG